MAMMDGGYSHSDLYESIHKKAESKMHDDEGSVTIDQNSSGQIISVQAQPATGVDMTNMTPEQRERVESIKDSINLNDASGILNFGSEVQQSMSDFADTILNETRTNEAGDLGKKLTTVVQGARSLDVSGLNETPNAFKSFLTRLPILGPIAGRMIGSVEHTVLQFNTVKEQIENVQEEMEGAQEKLHGRITMLQDMYERNIDQYHELTVYLAAGQMKLKEARENDLPELERIYAQTKDPLDAAKLKEFRDYLHRFEKKLSDLEVTRASVLQTGPQIKAMEHNAATLIENIQIGVTSIIPNWKKQFVLAISLEEQRRAADLNDMLYDANNEIIRKNAETLGTTMTQVAQQNQRSVIDVETLKHTHDQMIKMLSNVARIQKEGEAERARTSVEIKKLEKQMHTTLLAGGNGAKKDTKLLTSSSTPMPQTIQSKEAIGVPVTRTKSQTVRTESLGPK